MIMDNVKLANLFRAAIRGGESDIMAMVQYALSEGENKHLRNKTCALFGRVLESKGIKLSAANLRIRFDACALAVGFVKPTVGQAKSDEELLASFN